MLKDGQRYKYKGSDKEVVLRAEIIWKFDNPEFPGRLQPTYTAARAEYIINHQLEPIEEDKHE